MEEKQMMTNQELESQLKSLRVKETITKILTCCAAVAMIIMWLFSVEISFWRRRLMLYCIKKNKNQADIHSKRQCDQ